MQNFGLLGEYRELVRLNTKSAKVRKSDLYDEGQRSQGYAQNPISEESSLVSGNFKKENSIKSAAISRVNRTLRNFLLFLVLASFAGYYFAMVTEYNLNNLSRQISTLNDENAELENDLNRLKSLSNVDNKVTQSNFLHKAGHVLQVNAIGAAVPESKKVKISSNFEWSIGY